MSEDQEARVLEPVEDGESGFIGYDDDGDELYRLDDGREVDNRSAYIRQEFEKDRSRGDIAEELDISYNIVYGATANMENATTGAGHQVLMEDGTPRNEYIQDQLEDKTKTRREVADEMGVSYNIVYAASKDMDVKGGRGHMALIEGELAEELDVEDGTPRRDYIQAEYAKGKTRREIADELGVDYSVAWNATSDMEDPNADEEADEADEDASEETNDGVIVEDAE